MRTITFTVKKTPNIAEWQARFHVDGQFRPEWTIFETDKQSATDSANATVERFNAYEAASLQAKHVEDIEEDAYTDVVPSVRTWADDDIDG